MFTFSAAHARLCDPGRTQDVPVEIAAHTFAYLPFQDLVCATHVCHYWRSTALHCPALWSTITSSCRVPGVLEALLDRAEPYPVSLSVTFHSLHLASSLRAMRQHMHHIRALLVVWSAEQEEGPAVHDVPWSILNALERPPAPILEVFHLKLDQRLDSQVPDVLSTDATMYHLPPLVFRGHAPKLHSVSVHGAVILHLCSALNTVTMLDYETPHMSSWCVAALTNSLPNLQYLRLVAQRHSDTPDNISRLRLRHLDLHSDSPKLLRHFDAQRVRVTTYFDDDWFSHFDNGGRRPIHHLTASGPFSSMSTSIRIANEDGTYAIVLPCLTLRTTEHTRWQQFRCVSLRELSIWENFLYRTHWSPHFEQLSRLRVYVLEWSCYEQDLPSMFHDTRFAGEGMKSPNLRSLELARIVHNAPLELMSDMNRPITVAPEDVRTFIRAYLRFDAPRLDALTFQGVDLITTVPAELCALFALADSVSVDDTPRSYPFDSGMEVTGWTPFAMP